MQLQTGDILFVDTEGIVASSIDWFQGNDLNHVGIIIVANGKTWVFEAIDSGNAYTDFEDYKKRLASDEDLNLYIGRTKENTWDTISLDDIECFAKPLTDGFYNYLNLTVWQMVKYTTLKIFGKALWIGKTEEEIIKSKSYICGQLVMRFFNHFFGWYPNWGDGAPVDLFTDNRIEVTKFN